MLCFLFIYINMLIYNLSMKWQWHVSAKGNHFDWPIYRMNSTQGKTSAARTPMFTCLSNARRNNTTVNHTSISYLQKGILYSLLYLHQMSNSMLLFTTQVEAGTSAHYVILIPCIMTPVSIRISIRRENVHDINDNMD
jgi:hypothetical protein